MHFREIHASLFKDAAFTHHAGTPTTSFRPIPALFLKLANAVDLFEA